MLIIAAFIFDVMLKIKKAKCFGEPGIFGVGLILLGTIFTAILAFDKKCQYIRVDNQDTVNQEEINKENNSEEK